MMARSGNVRTQFAFGYVDLSWQIASQSASDNITTISYSLSIYRSENITSLGAKKFTIGIDGLTVSSGATAINGSGIKIINVGTFSVRHNVDGRRKITLSFAQELNFTWHDQYFGFIVGDGSFDLDTIPQATIPEIEETVHLLGSSISIDLNRDSPAFTHNLSFRFFGASGTIETGAEDFAEWTPSIDLADQIPNRTDGTAVIICKTFDGSDLIGQKEIPITLTVPDSVVPVIDSVTRSEAVTQPDIASLFGFYVQHKSRIKVITAAHGAHDSTIERCRVIVKDATKTEKPVLAEYFGIDVTTDILHWACEEIEFSVIVTDSRGRSATSVFTESVKDYFLPKINYLHAARCDSDGNLTHTGSKIKCDYSVLISPLQNLNTGSFEISISEDRETWITVRSGEGYSVTGSVVLNTNANPNTKYYVRLIASDVFDDLPYFVIVPEAYVLIDFRSSGKGIGIGKESTKDCLEIGMDVDLSGKILQMEKVSASLQNSWRDYDSIHESASFWKDSMGVVHVSGVISNGITTAGTTIFALPEGFRPAKSERFAAASSASLSIIEIDNSGNVKILSASNSSWISLSGINFKT